MGNINIIKSVLDVRAVIAPVVARQTNDDEASLDRKSLAKVLIVNNIQYILKSKVDTTSKYGHKFDVLVKIPADLVSDESTEYLNNLTTKYSSLVNDVQIEITENFEEVIV